MGWRRPASPSMTKYGGHMRGFAGSEATEGGACKPAQEVEQVGRRWEAQEALLLQVRKVSCLT